MAVGTKNTRTHDCIDLQEVIRDELSAVQRKQADLMTPQGPWGLQALTLSVCILINLIFFLTRSDYFGLFIAASFYLNMYYFITLIIPAKWEKNNIPAADFSRFSAWLKEIGISSGVSEFSRLFINSLFINSRALSLGIGLIFSVDIVFALLDYHRGGIPLRTTLTVITQCAIIVTFYLLVWRIEPFSTTYGKKVEQVKRSLRRKKLPKQVIAVMFIFGFLLAIFLFLITIIYLPGVTLNAFLNYSRLTELGHLFALLAVLAVSQYFVVRYIHGITSRTMAERLFEFKKNLLSDILDTQDGGLPGNPDRCENPLKTTRHLLEAKIYTVKRSTLFGAFPVFVVDVDFSVMLDSTTLTAIKGYVIERQH